MRYGPQSSCLSCTGELPVLRRSTVLTFACILGLLAGCSKHTGGGEQPSASLPKITVVINSGEEGKAIAALAKNYDQANVVVVELPYTDLREKLSTSLSSGSSSYDVVMLDDPWFPEFANLLANLEPV